MTNFKQRDSYRHFTPITTRWHDNDLYGHLNNVVYYGFFDTAVNGVLIEQGGLDIYDGPVIGLVVSSGCDYHAPVAFPERIEVALAVSFEDVTLTHDEGNRPTCEVSNRCWKADA